MSSLEDRMHSHREPINASKDFFVILLFSLTGLVLSGVLAFAVATGPVLLAWSNPV
jgi:hypothetical protein